MFLKIHNVSPCCSKQLPGAEHTGESWLHYDKYTGESRLPGLFGTNIRTGLQKKLLVPNTAGSHDSIVYLLHGSFDSLESLPPASIFANQFWSTPRRWIYWGDDYEYE